MCEAVASNLGNASYQILNSLTPCESLLFDIQLRLAEPFYSPYQRLQRVEKWLEFIQQNRPILTKKFPNEANTQLISLFENGCTETQLFYFPFLLPHWSNLGYPKISISKISRREMYQLHREFRNEWFSLFGKLTTSASSVITGFLNLHIWRHTDLPSNLWDTSRSATDYSSILVSCHILWPGETTWISYVSPIVPEAWNIFRLADQPFSFQFGNSFLNSEQAGTLFPMRLSWSHPSFKETLNLELDNNKPVCMTSSNGCFWCKDGLGLKGYKFPSVLSKNAEIHFQGSFEHTWEAGLIPEAIPAASYLLRSVLHVENNLFGSRPLNDWIYIHFQLKDNRQLLLHVVPMIRQLMVPMSASQAVLIKADGTMHNLKDARLTVQAISNTGYILSVKIEHSQFTCSFSTIDDANVGPVYAFRHLPGWFHWTEPNGSMSDGFGFIQSSPGNTFETTAHQILQEHFHQSLEFHTWKTREQFFSTEPSIDTLSYAWLVWALPVIIVIILCLVLIYVIWMRRHRLARALRKHQPTARLL